MAKKKSFKLDKIYPGSPVHGTIVTKYDNNHYSYYCSIQKTHWLILKVNVENFPEFWRPTLLKPKTNA